MSEPKPPDVHALISAIRTLAAMFAPLFTLNEVADHLAAQETAIAQYEKRLTGLREDIAKAETEREERKQTWARAQDQQQAELQHLRGHFEQVRANKEIWMRTHEQRLDELKDLIRVENERLQTCHRDTRAADAELTRVRGEIAETLKGLSTMAGQS